LKWGLRNLNLRLKASQFRFDYKLKRYLNYWTAVYGSVRTVVWEVGRWINHLPPTRFSLLTLFLVRLNIRIPWIKSFYNWFIREVFRIRHLFKTDRSGAWGIKTICFSCLYNAIDDGTW
jgi:hypothetical protein